MNRFVILFFLFAVASLATSCDKQFQQTVSVKFVSPSGKPLQGIAFRYYTDGACKGQFKSAVTSNSGEASISRVSIKGGVGVLLEEPSLCIKQKGKWYKAWQEFIDPAIEENFICVATSTGMFSCERLDQVSHT